MRSSVLVLLSLFAGIGWSADVTLPDYERVVLENGTVLLLSEKHEVPLIGVEAAVRGGSIADPEGKEGLAELLATVMQKGAGKRDAAEFAEAAAAVGGRISASADMEAVTLSAEFLSRDAELMISLLADLIMRPSLAEEELDKERDRSIGLIKSAKDSQIARLMPLYSNAYILGDHAYGRPASGSEASLAEISHEDLLQHYSDFFGGDRLVIAVVGDFDLEAMKARLTGVFGRWAAAAVELPTLSAPVRRDGRRVLLVDKPGAAQTHFWIGNTGVSIDYPRRAELNLANTVFGGRFTSMLMTALRVESGLTYGARSGLVRHSLGGTQTVRSYTETSTTVAAIDMALEVLQELHDDGVGDEMLISARNYIMGQFPPSLETASSVADMLAFLELNGLDRSYIDGYGSSLAIASTGSVAATISEVYPDSENLVFVIIGDAEKIRNEVGKYGPVTEMSITEPRFAL